MTFDKNKPILASEAGKKGMESRWEGKEKRSRRVTVYMTDEEFERLKKNADDSGMSRNAYICGCVFLY